MGLEAATYISQLVASNPGGSDAYSTADDHLRLIKSVLQAQFTSLGAAAVTVTAAELNVLSGSTGAVERQANKNAASGYAGLDGSAKLTKALQHASTVYTDVTNVFSQSQAIRGAGNMSFELRDTTQAADSRAWLWITVGTNIELRAYNDALVSSGAAIQVSRSGTTITGINFGAATVQWNGINLMTVNTAISNGQVPLSAVAQYQANLAIAFTQLTGSIANAQVPVGAVTQHQASLSIGYGQLTGVPSTFTPSAHNHSASELTSGTLPDLRVALSNVTQHQGSLSIGWGQLTGVPGTFTPSAHNQDAGTITTGTFADARIAASNVTQHEGALTTRNITGKAGKAKTLVAGSGPPSLSGATDGDMWYYY